MPPHLIPLPRRGEATGTRPGEDFPSPLGGEGQGEGSDSTKAE